MCFVAYVTTLETGSHVPKRTKHRSVRAMNEGHTSHGRESA